MYAISDNGNVHQMFKRVRLGAGRRNVQLQKSSCFQ